jgi:hypothetical protein
MPKTREIPLERGKSDQNITTIELVKHFFSNNRPKKRL